MAGPQFNTEKLIENIQRRCSVPTSQLTYTEEDFTDLANDEMQGEIVPLIMSTREEYFVSYVDIPSPADGIIDIPEYAVGAKLRSVCYVQQTSPLTLINLPRIDLDIVAGVGVGNMTTFAGFYIQDNSLVLYPNTSVSANTTIRLYYYRRTLALAAPQQYGQVTSVDPLTNTVILDYVPSSWVVGTKLNSVSGKPTFNTTNYEMVVVTLSAPSVILDTVEGIEIGDYFSEQGFSAIPQIPLEAHAYLAQLTAVKCLEGLGDREGMQAAQAKADKLKTNLLIMISQRVDGSVKKVMSASGGLRTGAGLRWGRGRGF